MPGGAKERLILFAWMKKSLNRQAGGKRGEWSAAYLYPRIGLRLCGWPKHDDSEETATVQRSISEPVDRIMPFGIGGEVVD